MPRMLFQVLFLGGWVSMTGSKKIERTWVSCESFLKQAKSYLLSIDVTRLVRRLKLFGILKKNTPETVLLGQPALELATLT